MIVLSIKLSTYNKDDSITLQKDLSTLSDWARIWQMNFNIDKCILKSGTLTISSLFARLKWCKDVRQDGSYQITDSKVA